MKTTNQKSSVTKLLSSFDKELRNILMSDLKTIKSVKAQLLNINSNTLSAA